MSLAFTVVIHTKQFCNLSILIDFKVVSCKFYCEHEADVSRDCSTTPVSLEAAGSLEKRQPFSDIFSDFVYHSLTDCNCFVLQIQGFYKKGYLDIFFSLQCLQTFDGATLFKQTLPLRNFCKSFLNKIIISVITVKSVHRREKLQGIMKNA